MKNISKKIREARVKKGLTLEELGEKINFNYSNLSKIERGVRSPTLELLEKLAEFYEVPLSYFFGEEIEVPDPLKKIGVEWVTFAEEMEEKEITPDDIKAIMEILNKIKK